MKSQGISFQTKSEHPERGLRYQRNLPYLTFDRWLVAHYWILVMNMVIFAQ